MSPYHISVPVAGALALKSNKIPHNNKTVDTQYRLQRFLRPSIMTAVYKSNTEMDYLCLLKIPSASRFLK